jgi:hypothetical protein
MSKTDQRSPITLPTSLTESSIGCGVTVDSNGNAVLPSAGGSIIGILYSLTGTGTGAVIRTPCDGALLAQLGGTVTLPTALKVNASGQFVTASAGDVAAGAAVAVALDSGASGELRAVILFGGAAGLTATGGVQDIVLGTTAPDGISKALFVSTTGTQTGAVPDGKYVGQPLDIVQYTAATTPVGTLTGHFKSQAGVAKTTLALGTATGFILRSVWDGAGYRQVDTLGGTGSGLS